MAYPSVTSPSNSQQADTVPHRLTMASNALSDINDEFFVCQVCLEDFKQPKMLPCLHTFCQQCLEKLLATEPVGKLDCPTCRQDVSLPQNGVQGLKSNFLVGKLRDILQQQPQAETSEAREEGVPCTVCKVVNSAQFYCVECTDYLCQACNKVHCGLKVTRSHKVVHVTVEDLKSEQASVELRARETSKCEDHQELNKFYCDTCHRVICLHCVVTAHKDHQYVEIEKAAEREGAKIKAKLARVKNTADLHKNWIQELQSVKEGWSSEVQRTEEQIRKRVNSIRDVLNKVEDDRIAQLRAMNAARKKQMEAAMEATEMDLASARRCVQITDNVLEYGSSAELMSVAAELTGQLEEMEDEKKAGKFEMTKDLMNLTFDPSTSNVESEVSKFVGEIKKTTIPMFLITQVRPNVVIGNGESSIKLIQSVGEKGTGDRQFDGSPTSLAVTGEGDIVVTDRYNSSLKFWDKNGSFKMKVKLGFDPLCVAALTNDELLVTGDRHRIHVLDKQGRESRVIQVGPMAAWTLYQTTGIAVDGLGRIIVTIGCQVFVLSFDGEVMLKFGDKDQGQWELMSFLHVAVNSKNEIIVTDKNHPNYNLKIFDPTGRHLVMCGSCGSGPGQLGNPWSVITDRDDNIIVADQSNHRVSLFSRDGTFIRHVLAKEEHGLKYPLALALTHEGNLIVSCSGLIKIFATK